MLHDVDMNNVRKLTVTAASARRAAERYRALAAVSSSDMHAAYHMMADWWDLRARKLELIERGQTGASQSNDNAAHEIR